jgi:hypothetical protein
MDTNTSNTKIAKADRYAFVIFLGFCSHIRVDSRSFVVKTE